MTYTVWMQGQKIGETKFELRPGYRKRAGSFQPTNFGVTMLPGVTDMFPALLAFNDMCRREGIDADDDSPEKADEALNAFGGTPEGQRVIAAAKRIAELHLHDPRGRVVPWESIAISDIDELTRLAGARAQDGRRRQRIGGGDPIKYMISVTVGRGALAHAEHSAAKRRQTTTD